MSDQNRSRRKPSTKQLLDWARRYGVRHSGEPREPIIAEASGATFKDTDGKEYLDISSGQMAVTVGHNHPKVVEAVKAMADKVIHVNHSLCAEAAILLAKRLAEATPAPLKKVLLLNTGSEANEVALKMAKMHTGRFEIASLQRGYHGHTGGALSATFSSRRVGFGPLAPGAYAIPTPYCYRCPLAMTFPSCDYACAKLGFEMLDSQTVGDPAAFIAEPILSGGGIVEPPPGYFPAVKRMCDERGMLFILDEAQTGMGRLGEMYAFEQDGVVPDILSLSKTMGGGVPLSATVTTPAIEEDLFSKGFAFRTSHMGDPLTAAAGLAVLDILEEENLLQQAREKGAYLKGKLLELKERHPVIGDVRGRGLLLGVEFVKDPVTKERAPDECAEITRRCLQSGLWVDYSLDTCVWRVAPPLTISYRELDEAVEIIDGVIQEVCPF